MPAGENKTGRYDAKVRRGGERTPLGACHSYPRYYPMLPAGSGRMGRVGWQVKTEEWGNVDLTSESVTIVVLVP